MKIFLWSLFGFETYWKWFSKVFRWHFNKTWAKNTLKFLFKSKIFFKCDELIDIWKLAPAPGVRRLWETLFISNFNILSHEIEVVHRIMVIDVILIFLFSWLALCIEYGFVFVYNDMLLASKELIQRCFMCTIKKIDL